MDQRHAKLHDEMVEFFSTCTKDQLDSFDRVIDILKSQSNRLSSNTTTLEATI